MLALTLLLALQDADALVASGTKKLEAGQIPAAIEDFTKALALQPENVGALVGRGKCRSKTPDLKGALQDLQEAVRLAPRSADAWFWKGVVREQAKDLAGAVEDYGQSLEAGARNPVVLLRRGTCLNSLDRHEEALPDFDRIIDGGMRTFESFSGRARARMETQNHAGAVSDLSRLMQFEAGTSPVLLRFVSYWGMRSWSNALRDAETLLERKGLATDEAMFWIWALRSRQGERERAARDLSAHLSARGADHAELRPVLEFLAGRSDAIVQPSAFEALALGIRKHLDGSLEEALPHLERAARLAPVDSCLARIVEAERCTVRRDERIRVLDELEARFRKLGPFEAELEIRGGEVFQGEFSISKVTLSADLSRHTLLYRLYGTVDGAPKEGYGLVEGGRVTIQLPGEVARQGDAGREFEEPGRWEASLNRELHQLLPKAAESARGRRSHHLRFDIEPKTVPGGRGALRFSCGWASHAASWFSELRTPGEAAWKREGDRVVFDIPHRKKRIEIDAETGFLRAIRVQDCDGKPREGIMGRVRPLKSLPDLPRPDKPEPFPMNFADYVSKLREQDDWLDQFVSEVIGRWDEIAKAGKEAEVRAVVTRTGARLLDSLDRHFARSMSREYVKAEIDRGVRADELLKNRDAEAEKFRKIYAEARAKGIGVLRARMAELAWDVETAALEWPVDSRHHGALRSLLKEALPFEALDAERAKNHPDSVDKVFREELEALRQL